METINLLKSTGVTIVSVLLSYLAPLTDVVFVIFYVFLINFVAGLVEGTVIEREKFSVRKFFMCLVETLVYFIIVISVYTVGEKMGNVSGAMQCISGVTYAIIYFYTVNIIRNLKMIFPDSMVLKFLYYLLSFEVVKKIPYMQQFINNEKKNRL